MKKIIWAVTGAGHLLEESMSTLVGVMDYGLEAELYLSDAAREVIATYDIELPLKPLIDKSASAMTCKSLYSGKYDLLVVSPATSNSVAKFVCGISDTVVTTLFAQAGKAGVPIIVLPTDTEESVDTMGATKPIKVKGRKVDLDNVGKLESFEGVTVVKGREDLVLALTDYA